MRGIHVRGKVGRVREKGLVKLVQTIRADHTYTYDDKFMDTRRGCGIIKQSFKVRLGTCNAAAHLHLQLVVIEAVNYNLSRCKKTQVHSVHSVHSARAVVAS